MLIELSSMLANQQVQAGSKRGSISMHGTAPKAPFSEARANLMIT